MMSKHFINSILFSCLLFLGCGNDPFVNIIELDDRPEDPVYAATAQWAVQDTMLRVFLCQSIFVSTPAHYDSLPNATVYLRHDDQEDYFIFNPITNYYESEIPLPTNEKMELFVEIDNTVLRAEQRFPLPPSAVDLTDLERIVDSTGIKEYGQVNISISDNSEKGNYYIIEMQGIGISLGHPELGDAFRDFSVGSDNPIVENNTDKKVFISDKEFNGNAVTFQISYSSFIVTDLKEVTLRVRSVSKEGYDYESSAASILEGSSNPLAEPVTLKSNIENGIGVFSVGSTYEATVRF